MLGRPVVDLVGVPAAQLVGPAARTAAVVGQGAELTVNIDREVEVLPLAADRQSADPVGARRAENGAVVAVDHAVAVEVGHLYFAGLLPVEGGQIGLVELPDAHLLVVVVYAVHRIAHEKVVVQVLLHAGILQTHQLLLVAVVGEIDVEGEVLLLDGNRRERNLPTAVARVADVRPGLVEARGVGQHLQVEQVVAL